jgi:hypothetical protein
MPPGPLAGGSVLGREPAHIAEIADLRVIAEDGRISISTHLSTG